MEINRRVSNKISYLYLILSIMILALHCVYMELFQSSVIANEVNNVFRIIYNMAVPTFYFVSALLFYKDCETKNYMYVIKKKFKSLIVPYLLWNVICWPLKEVKNYLQYGTVSTLNFFEILRKILMSEWNPVLWFIRVLFLYFLIYPIILKVIKKKKLCIAVIILIVVLNFIIGPKVGYSSMRYWLPVYMTGAYLSYWNFDSMLGDSVERNKYKIVINIILLSALICFAYLNDYGLYLCRLVSPILFWGIADILLIEQKPCWWMKQTFYFYCAQMIFSIVAQKIYIFIFGTGIFSAVIANVIIPLILLCILILTAYTIRIIMPPVWNVLTGNRR